MKYNGTIKATYAEIRNAAGETLFSFQHADAGSTVLVLASGQPDSSSNQLMHVALTDAALRLIQRKSAELYSRVAEAMNSNDIYVKPIAWNWKQDNSKIFWIGAAALALLVLTSKKKRS